MSLRITLPTSSRARARTSGVHQVLREEDRAEERLARLDALEHLGVRDDLVDLVLLHRVALEPLDGLRRKEPVNVIEPLGHAELVEAPAAGAATAMSRSSRSSPRS